MPPEMDLGPWGVDLDEEAFGRSLAAIGVTAAAAGEGSSLAAIIRDASDLQRLRRLLPEQGSIGWRIERIVGAPPDEWASLAGGPAARGAAMAWGRAVDGRDAMDVPRLRIERLRVSVDRCAWLADLLGHPGVTAASFVAVEPASASPAWRWPPRVGFLDDPASAALRQRLPSGDAAGAPFLTVAAEEGPVDLLLLPQSMPAAVARLLQLGHQLDAGSVLVLGGLGAAGDIGVDQLVAAVGVRVAPWSVAIATMADADVGRWFSALLRALAGDVTLDVALRSAFTVSGRGVLFADPGALDAAVVSRAAARHAASTALGDRRYYASDEPGASTTAGADAAADPANELRSPRHERPTLVRSRWLQVEIREGAGSGGAARRAALRAATSYAVDVWVGPRTRASIRGRDAFPEAQLQADEAVHRLQVVFAELGPHGSARTRTGEIDLPREGASTHHRFHILTAGPGMLRVRIVVLYRNRILQTAVLSAAVSATGRRGTADAIRLRIEAVVRPALADLDHRRRFSAAVVHNQDEQGDAGGTAMSGGRAIPLQLGDVKPTVDTIVAALSAVADDPDAYGPQLDSDATVRLVYRLANHGFLLRRGLFEGRPRLAEMLGRADRIQILAADPNSTLPLEFIYDFPLPSEPQLCHNARQALLDGHCDASNHPVAPDGTTPFVCPVGFWAMNRVIERHVADPVRFETDLRGVQFELSAEPVEGRDRLGGLASALFAASAQVDVSMRGGIASVEASLTAATGGHAKRVKTWDDWVSAVAADRPSLLVLLAHTARDDVAGQTALEIETGERRPLARFGMPFVRATTAAAPIVLLLGCDTAVTDMEYQTFVTQFRSAGAALVVGTIATVAGRHAAGVASALSDALARPVSRPWIAFGDLLLAARRELLAGGEVMALCLTAYGDAEWRFPATQG